MSVVAAAGKEEVAVKVDDGDDDDDASAEAARAREDFTAACSSSLSAACTDATETEEALEAEEAAAAAALLKSYLLRSSAPVAGSRGSALILAINNLDLDADCVDSAERIRCSPSPVAVAVRKSVGACAEKTRASRDCGVPTTWYLFFF